MFTVKVLEPDSQFYEAHVREVEIEFPKGRGDYMYDEMLDDYISLSKREAEQLMDALRAALVFEKCICDASHESCACSQHPTCQGEHE